MANVDLQAFLEDRLRALDPTIDLDPGSPAQLQFISPVLDRLGTDPFETNIEAFLADRFSQEFPDIYAQDPSVVRDIFSKPLIVLLEPFKREINTIKINKSLLHPELLSDDDADALVANVFDERDSGGFAVGTARILFSQPTNQQVQITNRVFTSSGLNFYPSTPVGITAEQMVFQKQGTLYFMDVPVKAEKEGDEYNITAGDIAGVDGIYGAVNATNPRDFTNGSPKLDTPSFIASARESLTERSLVTRRGASAILRQTFQTQVRAIQVIGAGDPEMQRDILVAASPGHSWLLGKVNITGEIAYVQCRVVDGDASDAPVPGDTLFIYLDRYAYSAIWSGLDEGKRLVRLTVEEVLVPQMEEATPFRLSYVVRFSGDLPTGVILPDPAVLEGGFSKKGTIRVSSLPDIGEVSFSVPNGSVHLFGHSDIYARPILQAETKAVLAALSDSKSFVERQTLKTTGLSNAVTDDSFDFIASGVTSGDVLLIETGNDAGTYTIHGGIAGTPGTLYLSANLTNTDLTGSIRYRILKQISINPFEPVIPKFPFGNLLANDLSTTIGSVLFSFGTDLLGFGAKVGDTIRVLAGTDAGDFTITGFDPVLGGQGVLVNRAANGSNSTLQYEVFTGQDPVVLPLVRLKQLLLLDSAKQSTGISVPPAEPVSITPTCDFSTARVRGLSQRASGYVLPDVTGWISGGNVAAPSGDRRYSLGFDPFTGTYRAMQFADGSYSEFDFTSEASGVCSWFVATSEATSGTTNYPPIDPHPGEALTIKTGPNAGSYLIKQVVKFKHKLATPTRDVWSYFIQIYGTFPVDVFRELIDFLDAAQTAGAAGAGVTKITGTTIPVWPDFFLNTANALGSKLVTALAFYGATPPSAPVLQAMVDSSTKCEYEWGDPARGVLRTFFTEPTLFQQATGQNKNPTTFVFTTPGGGKVHFRPDPARYAEQEIVPPRLRSDSQPVDYPRDLDGSVPNQATFSDSPTMFNVGVATGDVLEVFEEVLFHGTVKTNQTAIQTVAGSTKITAPTTSGAIFTKEMEGNLFFIEEGVDAGGYRVVTFVDEANLILDKPMTVTTPNISNQGLISQWGNNGTDDVIIANGAFNFTPYINKYITIYGLNTNYQGSYQITGYTAPNIAKISKAPDFPVSMASPSDAHFVITEAPATSPTANASGNGTELYGLRPIRMYNDVSHRVTVTSVTQSPTTSQVGFSATLVDGFMQPYRLFRPNVRRVTPTEMSDNPSGSLFFFDTEVISFEPQATANLDESSYLTLVPDSYVSYGYRHRVDDSTLTYSMKESGTLEIPTKILPVLSEDSPQNFISLVGVPLEISYERSALIQQLQEFLDSPEDKVTAANLLARHFLPSYVSYDAQYVGGSAPSVVAADIISYINTLPIETPIDVSDLQTAITRRGGDPDTPTTVVVVLHDWDRKVWAEFSQNEIGGIETAVPYNGTPRVSYCIAGPDASGQDPLPTGERINLTRR